MKKFLITTICLITVLSLLFVMSCGRKAATAPSATNTAVPAAKTATMTPVAPSATNTMVVASSATNTPVNTATVTSTITPTPISTVLTGALNYNFDDGALDGWAVDSCCAAFSNAAPETTITQGGSADAVAITLQLTGNNQGNFDIKSIGGTMNLSGKTFTMWVYPSSVLTSDVYAIDIFVQGNNWATTDNNWIICNTLTPNVWNEITYTIPTDIGTESVNAIGLNIQQAGGAAMTASDTIYVDTISVQ